MIRQSRVAQRLNRGRRLTEHKVCGRSQITHYYDGPQNFSRLTENRESKSLGGAANCVQNGQCRHFLPFDTALIFNRL